jgi:glucose/arabinose dehydrogenase
MGRTAAGYAEANLTDHLLGGIQWAAGMVRAGCKATINSNYQSVRLNDAADGGLARNGESHGLVVAPNGWVIYIGRADCRTPAERGAVAGGGSTERIFDHADPNVAIGCGTVHVWDPEEADGSLNSGTTRAGTLAVYGDLGTGGERIDQADHKSEEGLLGITLAPDFMETGHVYLQYVPTLNPDTMPPGLSDGAQRRITKMGKVRISRFTMDLETKALDLGSEVKIFEYETQLWSCCHRGGGTGFDSEGNLYFTTGDSNSSQGTSGTSGNNSTATCPTGDPNVASNAHCGANGVSYQDARRTAGNTNDYNGKLLRIKPIPTIPDGTQPQIGVGTTYTIPGADAPNGPNLFDGTEGNGSQAKPEIFAMGLRNPARLTIDPETDVPYSAWVGPDAGGPNVNLGPSSFEVASQIPQAGNYGWPYCADGQQAYRDRTSDGQVRTDSPAGFVNGGPGGTIPGWYDCDNLVNNSIRNTGLTVLPHETGTGMDAGTARQANVWYGRGNPGGANGCPEFPREGGATSAPNYAGTPTALCPYITASGATVMSGPLYRYDEGVGDDSARWPEYWDGRWFLHDFSGGQSVRHGLLLDPDTAAEGSQPVYADNMKQIITWSGGSYMDSKFGPDGALYVQLYGPYFRVGNSNGLYRVTYVGGPDTPGPDPQWEATGNPREIEFSIGASGGVSYEWDFDNDGTTDSTAASPTHTYPTDGTKQAKLTVTYADGETASQTVDVNVSGADTAAPVTTATLDPANPGPGGTYDGPVEIALAATDDGGSGVELTQYKIDGGAFQEYSEPFTISADGAHVVEYRSRDVAGNVEETKSVEFTIETDPGGGEGCLPQSDEFNGTALDPKWEILRGDPNLRAIGGGELTLTMDTGDMLAPNNTAKNVLLQDVPDDEWTVTTKVEASEITSDGQAAGLVIWEGEDPDSFAKATVQFKSEFLGEPINDQWVERGLSVNDSVVETYGGRHPHSDPFDPQATVWLRATFDGTNYKTLYSLDGQTWQDAAPQFPAAELDPAAVKVGLFVKHDGGTTAAAGFDWVRFTDTADPTGPTECDGGGGGCTPESDLFEGTTLDGKWQILNPNATNPVTVSGGHAHLPLLQGDLYGGNGSAANLLLQQAPAGQSWVATAKVAHDAIDEDGEAAGLALINSLDPNYFAKTGLQYKSDTDPNTPGDQNGKWAERVLTTNGSAVTLPGETVPWPNSGALNLTGDYAWVRIVYDDAAKDYSTWTSTNGTTFTKFGVNMAASHFSQNGGAIRVGLFAKHDGGTADDVVDIDAFNLVKGSADPQTPGDDCGSGGGGDTSAPTTTATASPAEPDGNNGWYKQPVQVSLSAEDNEGGSGVETTEYRIDDGPWQAYAEPFTVALSGPHVVQYRSTDAEGNTEAEKSLNLKIDQTAPATTATQSGTGPVEVSLTADDGGGSGVTKTEFRVDGGEWREYVVEETILDEQADRANWKMAGPGDFVWNEADGGFFRTVGGLGMLWYPVRDYGDFSLKMQWRDSAADGAGNSGVFVRFPQPDEAVALPAPDRYPCQVGSGTSQPAWVAIFCGHEIQINDHQGDTQKTGSIYNFEPVLAPDAGIQPKGTWVDYEVKVEGQQYTIIRNGVVLNEFDNSIPKNSSRAGDPPTQDRQFSRGYIGLQNHGTPDVIDFRNVRVLPLDEGTVQGPIVVEGDGQHTVEYRSTDQAGNVEETKSVSFRIGAEPGGPGGPPGGGGSPAVGIEAPPKSQAKLATFARKGIEVSASCQGVREGMMRMTVKPGKARKLGLGKPVLASSEVRCGSGGSLTATLVPKGKVKRALKTLAADGGSLKTTLALRMSGPAGTASDKLELTLKGQSPKT